MSVSWNGNIYETIAEASKDDGRITPGALWYWLSKGYSNFDDIPAYKAGGSNEHGAGRPSKPCQWNGKWYESNAEAANDLGITYQAMQYRRRMGYTCDDDLKAEGRPKKNQD